MSFNENHMISISNYEEWFILYMDNELTAEQKKMVESFLLLHPHLQEEMDLLLSTKLPVEPMVFTGKEVLQATFMKLNTVDEALLLYIDNELPAAEKETVEEKITSDRDYRLQFELLQKTKADAAEVIPYPNKKELYRHTAKRVLLPVWMRVAAAAVVLLTGSYFFLLQQGSAPVTPVDVVRNNPPVQTLKQQDTIRNQQPALPLPPQVAIAKATTEKKGERKAGKTVSVLPLKEANPEQMASLDQPSGAVAIRKTGTIQVDVAKLNVQPLTAVNNSVANLPVTSVATASYNLLDNPDGAAVTERNENHRTPAKGFFRKVSRFIERRTGIGTVNANNELWVGAVALKLN